MPAPVRLDRHVADLMRCSRGEAQQYIQGGWVRVDGAVVEDPQAPIARQLVQVDDGARLEAAEPATLLWHKPAGIDDNAAARLITPANHSTSDATSIRILQRHFQHLQPMLPLDADASGLLVLTQDPRIRRRLVEDHAAIEQEFVVEIDGDVAPYGLGRIAEGLQYQGRTLPPCKVSWQNEVRLRFAVKDVRPGQLRDVCRQVGLAVVAIRRIRIGKIPLSKLPVGEWRYLPVGDRF